ncbi:MAG: nucleotide exchange factor GrpE [Prevotella sp.]|nr:nucleotide exchange factor GrpE [Prevotella sp.]
MKDQEKDLQEELQNIVNEAETETEEPQSTEAEDTETAESKEDVKEEVKDPLEVANETIADLNDKYLRKCAEFENFRRRSIKEKAELILNGGEKVITKILPVIDDMERAIENGKKTEDVATLRDGMELIYKKFLKILEGEGVKTIETLDKDFNVDYHEAIAMVPGVEDEKKGKVIDCVQTGYTLNDKVIRYAKVAVGQ